MGAHKGRPYTRQPERFLGFARNDTPRLTSSPCDLAVAWIPAYVGMTGERRELQKGGQGCEVP